MPDPKPEQLVKVHFILMIVWVLLAIPTLLVWKESILWVALMSVYAIVAAHLTGWDAARAELEASKQGDSEV